ncbi:phospholipid phosphatase-related protein type 1-like [Lingula anatina]|uniref:Phospholipid phosphatase-related protein type 1-like n=1 Tax=Lingula anatina TaxID=7574 RepID=A0A1S3HIA0_LINAN|nr:phospholipid phosphatase-related protein type 1-like [Lingula anatina]|eukprot:XP_013385843.1 phospholipid phosphatase-related protein type 1-like [Lingula anatina]
MVRHTQSHDLRQGSLPSDFTASLGKYQGLLRQYRESMGIYDNADSSSDTATYTTSHKRVNTYIIFIFIVEFLIMVFVAILEYFLRWTTAFPVRQQNFSCLDPSISHAVDGRQAFSQFALEANVSEALMLGACFLIPTIMIGIGESAMWLLNGREHKVVYAMCKQFKLPQMFRRMLRFVGVHMFGCLATMVVTDVTKTMAGTLRPNFLAVCKPLKNCTSDNVGLEVCTEKNIEMLRDARLSFPSLHASVTSFAAVFTSVYIHNSINTHQVRLLRPFFTLSLIIAALLAGLSRIGHHRNHWPDILAGYAIGSAVGFYLVGQVVYLIGNKVISKRI